MEIKEDGWYDGLGSRFSKHFFKKSEQARSRCGQIRKEIISEFKLTGLYLVAKPDDVKNIKKIKHKCGSCEVLLKGDIEMEKFEDVGRM